VCRSGPGAPASAWFASVSSRGLTAPAQVQQHAPLVVQRHQQVLALAFERADLAPGQRRDQPARRRQEEVARRPAAHARDAAPDQVGREQPAGDLDLGQLRHGYRPSCS